MTTTLSELAAFIDPINARLITNLHRNRPDHPLTFDLYLKRILYFFIYGDLVDNQYYNHFAFTLTEGLLKAYSRKPNTSFDKNKPLLGLTLIKSIDWGFLNATLSSTFKAIDENCALLAKNDQATEEELVLALVYLLERFEDNGTDPNSHRTLIIQLMNKLDASYLHEPVDPGKTITLFRRSYLRQAMIKQNRIAKAAPDPLINHSLTGNIEAYSSLISKLEYLTLLKGLSAGNTVGGLPAGIAETAYTEMNNKHIDTLEVSDCLVIGFGILFLQKENPGEQIDFINFLN